jgi:hypothetical protein
MTSRAGETERDAAVGCVPNAEMFSLVEHESRRLLAVLLTRSCLGVSMAALPLRAKERMRRGPDMQNVWSRIFISFHELAVAAIANKGSHHSPGLQ